MPRLFAATVATLCLTLCLFPLPLSTGAAELPDPQPFLSRPILDPGQPTAEVQAFCESRVPAVPKADTVAQWEQHAARIRADALDKVVFRGEAKAWRDAKTNV